MSRKNLRITPNEGQLGKTLEVLEISGPRRNTARRRTSVSAEPVDVSSMSAVTTRIIKKSEQEQKQIRAAVKTNFLFTSLTEEQMSMVVDAMELKKVAAGTNIIKQGEDGEEFFVIDEGECECFLDFKNGEPPKMVKHYQRGESFGELALMYNTTRAASIQAKTAVTLWVMDRATFRKVLMYTTSQKRSQYEDFLAKVPLLASMDSYERSKVADSLREVTYNNGERIITEGGTVDRSFFILASGGAAATKIIDGQSQVVMEYKVGDFFGELALLNDQPRAATVVAVGTTKVVALDRESFIRVLGPVEGLIGMSKGRYVTAEENVRKGLGSMTLSPSIRTLSPSGFDMSPAFSPMASPSNVLLSPMNSPMGNGRFSPRPPNDRRPPKFFAANGSV